MRRGRGRTLEARRAVSGRARRGAAGPQEGVGGPLGSAQDPSPRHSPGGAVRGEAGRMVARGLDSARAGGNREAGTPETPSPRSHCSCCSLSPAATSRTSALFRVFRATSRAGSGPKNWISCCARSMASARSSRPHGMLRPSRAASRSLWRKRFSCSWLRSSSAAWSRSRALAARASVLGTGRRWRSTRGRCGDPAPPCLPPYPTLGVGARRTVSGSQEAPLLQGTRALSGEERHGGGSGLCPQALPPGGEWVSPLPHPPPREGPGHRRPQR